MPKFLKSKTIIVALLLAVFGALQASMGVFTDYLTPEAYGLFTMAVGVIVAVLRVLTTVPLDEK